MFKNYIIMGFRTILKQKTSSLIAILGLALGITSSLLLYTYISFQFNSDNFLPKNITIKRVVDRRVDKYSEVSFNGFYSLNRYSAGLIPQYVPGVIDVATYGTPDYLTLEINGEYTNEDIASLSDNFFNMIPFPIISGSREIMQSEPNYIILDKNTANKYFPAGDALGKIITLHMNGGYKLKVTGVVDVPENSHLNIPNAFISEKIFKEFAFPNNKENIFTADSRYRVSVYIKTDPNYHEKLLNRVLDKIPADDEYFSEDLFTEDFKNIYLYSKDKTYGDFTFEILILLSVLTIILLSISIINSVSILTAGSITRTKEVGVRKVMGGSRKDLIFQFLIESIILSFIALIIGLVLAELILPAFSKLVSLDDDLGLKLVFSPMNILVILGFTLIVGIITGLYPAFYLSSLELVDSLKGKNLLKLGKFKKSLVVFQFVFASIVLVSCISLNNELKFLNKLDVGFNWDNLIYVFPGYEFDLLSKDKLTILKNKILKIDGVEKASYTTFIPYSDCPVIENTYISPDEITYQELGIKVGIGYFESIGLKPIEGEIKENQIVIMKSVKDYRNINVGDIIEFESKNYTVGAIVDDYYLKHALLGNSPKFHLVTDSGFYFQLIKFHGDVQLKEIIKVYKEVLPNKSVEVEILDIGEQNNLEIVVMLKKVMNMAMFITLFISILGLIGLILHSVKQKNKELGIRKVLGANFFTIIRLFVGDSLKYLITGTLIGIPLGVYLFTFGLGAMGYPFKMHNMVEISLLSGFILIVFGILLTFLLVFKSALSNPSNALRYE